MCFRLFNIFTSKKQVYLSDYQTPQVRIKCPECLITTFSKLTLLSKHNSVCVCIVCKFWRYFSFKINELPPSLSNKPIKITFWDNNMTGLRHFFILKKDITIKCLTLVYNLLLNYLRGAILTMFISIFKSFKSFPGKNIINYKSNVSF